MTKLDFLSALRRGLQGLPREDLEERLAFYGDMIDDRVEAGMSEEAAVAESGPVEDVINEILSEVPLSKLVKEKVSRKKPRQKGKLLLIILGSPLWIPLLAAAAAVVISLFAAAAAVLLSLAAAELALAAAGIFCVGGGLVQGVRGLWAEGGCLIGAGLICGGLAMLLFGPLKAAYAGILALGKRCLLAVKQFFVGKGNAQ